MREFKSDSARSLLAYLISCKQQKRPTPVLLLGAGVSITSGCPSTDILLEHISKRLGQKITNFDELGSVLNDEPLRLQLTSDLLGKTPSLGYRLLTQLVLRGYFDVILTTNWDFLLEDELRRHLNPEQLNIYSRPLISDKTLTDIISRPIENATVIRLHGDLTTKPLISPIELLSFDEPLERKLRSLIAERGIIIIGYSLQEIRISSLLSPNTESWYIEPFSLPINYLQQLNIQPRNIITNDDALMDNFLEGLCGGLLYAELNDRIMYDVESGFSLYNEKIDYIVDTIKEGLLVDTIPEETIESEIIRLLTKCQKLIGYEQKRICLTFIDDPSAPGGIAMYDQIMRSATLRKVIKDYSITIARITGRVGIKTADRITIDLREVSNFQWNDIDAVVIIDTVSFTAWTLESAQKYIEANYNIGPERCVAAVLRIDQQARDKLNDGGIRSVWNEPITTSRLMTPWGVTRPTSSFPVPSNKITLSIGKPLNASLFLPANNFWYNPKPWGDLTVFVDNLKSSTRILFFERFQSTSLHFHLLRDEVFIGLDDEFVIQLWDRQIRLKKHQALMVPAGIPHRVMALDTPFRVLELAVGQYEDQKDIFRITDIYNRKCGWESDGLE